MCYVETSKLFEFKHNNLITDYDDLENASIKMMQNIFTLVVIDDLINCTWLVFICTSSNRKRSGLFHRVTVNVDNVCHFSSPQTLKTTFPQ